jgi:hypothetical protein
LTVKKKSETENKIKNEAKVKRGEESMISEYKFSLSMEVVALILLPMVLERM